MVQRGGEGEGGERGKKEGRKEGRKEVSVALMVVRGRAGVFPIRHLVNWSFPIV